MRGLCTGRLWLQVLDRPSANVLPAALWGRATVGFIVHELDFTNELLGYNEQYRVSEMPSQWPGRENERSIGPGSAEVGY